MIQDLNNRLEDLKTNRVASLLEVKNQQHLITEEN